MSSPYFITHLETDILLDPSQMTNGIRENIEQNLLTRHNKKCFYNYGYIDSILEIDEKIKGGVIRAEDNTASSVHRVKFKCRICNPIKNKKIVATIVGINNVIIIARNGPITFIIDSNNINSDKIKYQKSAYYPIASNGDIIDKPIKDGTYVIVEVMNKKIVNGRNEIISIAKLDSAIPENEIENAIKNRYIGRDIEANELLKLGEEEEIEDNSESFESESDDESEHQLDSDE